MRSRAPVPLAALALVVAFSAPSVVEAGARHPASSTAATAAGGITFGTPTVVDPVHTYGEPDIKVAYDGSVYDSGPWGTGTQRSLWEQSLDGGRTFHVLHESPVTSPDQSDSQITGPGGGDTEISIDRANRVYYADLAALASLKVARWDKATHTMDVGFFGNGQQNINGVDRQWFALWDPADQATVKAATGYTGPLPVNYLIYTEALGSTDCSPPALGQCVAATYTTDGTNYVSETATADMASEAPLVIDQDTGTVIEGSSTNGGAEMDAFIWTRDPAKPGDPSLTKVEKVKVADLPSGDDPNALFPVTAFDQGRNAYMIWVTRNDDKNVSQESSAWQIFYSYATAASGWKTWSTPVQLSSSPSNTNIMPWAVAGADGRLAVVWYGTNDSTHNPSTDDVHQPWHVYLATVTNAATASPTVVQQRVTRHPMHYGSICLQGLGCAAQNPPGNRNLADFFEVSTDPRDGRLVITYDDTSNNLKQHDPSGSQAPPEQVAHTGAPVVVMVKQNGGTSLFGMPISGPKAVQTFVTDRKKDATFDPIYSTKNITQLDLTRDTVKKKGKNLVFKLRVASLANLPHAFDATGASAIDFVIRWVGAATKDPETGVTNPIYYAAVEITPNNDPRFFTGKARSIELCSVSGCFPHILEYPEPQYGGTFVTGKLVKTKGPKSDLWLVKVPLNLVGSPKVGSLLQDFGAYLFARNRPASQPITNADAQGGITPIMVDGVCCVELKLRKA